MLLCRELCVFCSKCCETRALDFALNGVAEALALAWTGINGAGCTAVTSADVRTSIVNALASCKGEDEPAALEEAPADGVAGVSGGGSRPEGPHHDEIDVEDEAEGDVGEVRDVYLFGEHARLAVVVIVGRSERGGSIAIPVLIPTRRRGSVHCCFCVATSFQCQHLGDARAVYAKRKRRLVKAAAISVRKAGGGEGGASAASGLAGEDGSLGSPWDDDSGAGDPGIDGDASSVSRAGLSEESLPLFNCNGSLLGDKKVEDLASSGEKVIVSAPVACISCGSRNGFVRVADEGVVMSANASVAKMVVQEFVCTDEGHDARDETLRISVGSGSKEAIVLYTMRTALTACLSRDLCSLHAGYGEIPLGSLLRNLVEKSHGRRRRASAGNVIMPSPRSIKTLRGCVYFAMRLMCEREEHRMFHCSNCERPGLGPAARISAVNSDGIFLGHGFRDTDSPFKRVYAETLLTAPTRDASRIPDQLVDAADTRRLLIWAINNDCRLSPSGDEAPPDIGQRTLHQSLLAVAILGNAQSGASVKIADVVGIGGQSVAVQAGRHSALGNATRGTSLLLSKATVASLAQRITTLQAAVLKTRRGCEVSRGPQVAARRRLAALETVEISLKGVINEGYDRDEVNLCLGDADLRAVRCLVQQILRDSSVALLCERFVPTAFSLCAALRGEEGNFDGAGKLISRLGILLASGPVGTLAAGRTANLDSCGNFESVSDKPCELTILAELRIVRDAVSAAAKTQSPASEASSRRVTEGLHCLLLGAAETAKGYYVLHRSAVNQVGTETAPHPTKGQVCLSRIAQYRKEWSEESFPDEDRVTGLIEKFRSSFPNAATRPHETGLVFPGRPQCRPLPFYGQTGADAEAGKGGYVAGDNEADDYEELGSGAGAELQPSQSSARELVVSTVQFISAALLGSCSKNYLETRKTFSPGAFTLTCACRRPIQLGIVVLDRDEGPLIPLNAFAAYFPFMPWYVPYDFACGAY